MLPFLRHYGVKRQDMWFIYTVILLTNTSKVLEGKISDSTRFSRSYTVEYRIICLSDWYKEASSWLVYSVIWNISLPVTILPTLFLCCLSFFFFLSLFCLFFVNFFCFAFIYLFIYFGAGEGGFIAILYQKDFLRLRWKVKKKNGSDNVRWRQWAPFITNNCTTTRDKFNGLQVKIVSAWKPSLTRPRIWLKIRK